ncbi:MAG TPA: sensor domain-containing diguanylate cyclase [Gemmatimonadaceae bacterium]|jgi:two-component system cell cycle response regulator|nr:sensor domain-containing diguanylate cyclase [Gemmatimonadaceae bacterium]
MKSDGSTAGREALDRTDATSEGELELLRAALRQTEVELQRVRQEAENKRHLVDIMHDVMGNLSTEEIFHMVARRLARALNLSHSSVILAKPGDVRGVVATAVEQPNLLNLAIELDRYPEVSAALEQRRPVLIQDLQTSPWYTRLREQWERDGTKISVRSVIALPFAFEKHRTGVFLLRRTIEQEPLAASDVEFADTVIKSAVNAIEQSYVIEQAKADNARLEALAHTDPLTHLLNRRALTIRLVAELERVRRYNSPLTILMIDIDHFKQVNDTYGHLVGDDVLRGISAILQRSVRTVDMVARYGGEEFVVVLPETGEQGAVVFAERIRERVEEHSFEAERSRAARVTVSIGVSSFPALHVDTAEHLLSRADAALYRAKECGRNKVCV